MNWLLWLISFLFLSCLNETGKDKHTDIPIFPRTTNVQVKFKLLSDNYSEIFFNDQNLIIAEGDSITIIDLSDLTEKPKVILGSFQCYHNNSFIYRTNDYYFALNDKNFTTQKMKFIDENQKYFEISDSLATTHKSNTDTYTKIVDSIYLNYFYKKYQISRGVIPYSDYLGDNYYIRTAEKDFILKDPPLVLREWIYDQKKPFQKYEDQNIYEKFDYREAESSTKFKKYDYSMIDKSWRSSGGGNHFIPAIPLFEETGFSYYRFLLGGEEGKFKISGSQSIELYDLVSDKNFNVLVVGTKIYLAKY